MNRADRYMTIAIIMQSIFAVFLIIGIIYTIQIQNKEIKHQFDQQRAQVAHNHITGIELHTLNCRLAVRLHINLQGTGC